MNLIFTRKLLLLTLLFVGLGLSVSKAQSYNFAASAGTYTPIAGSSPVNEIETDDAISNTIPIGFSFRYFGEVYTNLKASSNGFLTFDLNSDSENYNELPSNQLQLIAPLWDDLGGAGGQASYLTSGSAPNRVFTFEWSSWRWDYFANAGISFQVKLYETSNKIEFLYKEEAGSLDDPSASIGLMGPASTVYYSLSSSGTNPTLTTGNTGFNYIDVKPATNQTYSFTPAPITTPTVQASNIKAIMADGKLKISWQNGDGLKRLVVVTQTSSIDNIFISSFSTIQASSNFGDLNGLIVPGSYCVYNGYDNVAQVTNIIEGQPYLIQVIEYNGGVGEERYNNFTDGNNPKPITATTPVIPNYTFSSRTETYAPLAGGVRVEEIEGDDRYSNQIPIGFDFNFAGVRYSTLQASSNGFLTFNDVFKLSAENDLSNSEIRATIAPLWDDLGGYYNSTASYKTIGTSPNRVFTFEWLNWYWDYSVFDPNISFQVKLYEGSNKIEFVYRQESGSIGAGLTASIGLGFHGTGTNDFISLNNTTASPTPSKTTETFDIGVRPANGQVYVFAPPMQTQTLTFNAIPAKSFGGASFTLGATSNSPLPITYTSSNTAVATVSGNTVTIVGVGNTTITAFQVGDGTHTAATPIERELVVQKANQTISFSEIPGKLLGDAAFNLSATSSSGLGFTYSSSNTAVATISGNTVTIVGTGSTDITASQAGNSNYNSATIARTLSVKQGQTITFGELATKVLTDLPFALTATSSSNLTIKYTSSNTSVATISGATVTLIGAGTTTITASQEGNLQYAAATSVERSLTVSKASQTISFAEVSSKNANDAAFTLTATASSSLPVSYTTQSDKVSISGSTVSLLKAGSVTIKAQQEGNSNYTSATPVERTFCIIPSKPIVSVAGFGTESPVMTSSSVTGNQWYEDGVAVTGANTQTLTVPGGGVYTVSVKVDNCVSEKSAEKVFVITGTEEVADYGIRIYPNPTQENITIDLSAVSSKGSSEITMIDISGRLKEKITARDRAELNIKSYPSGKYFILIKTGSTSVIKSMIKN
jgi:hypothetical protein